MNVDKPLKTKKTCKVIHIWLLNYFMRVFFTSVSLLSFTRIWLTEKFLRFRWLFSVFLAYCYDAAVWMAKACLPISNFSSHFTKYFGISTNTRITTCNTIIFMFHIIIIIIIIIILQTLTNDFSLESEWQQIFSVLQDSSKYTSRI